MVRRGAEVTFDGNRVRGLHYWLRPLRDGSMRVWGHLVIRDDMPPPPPPFSANERCTRRVRVVVKGLSGLPEIDEERDVRYSGRHYGSDGRAIDCFDILPT